MPWPQTGATQYHTQLGLPDKDRTIKGLVFCNNWDLEPLDLLNGLALGCYQPSPEVLIVLQTIKRGKGWWYTCDECNTLPCNELHNFGEYDYFQSIKQYLVV